MKKIAILQSNYIPWKGYFDIINMVDEFILYDDMQYTRRDWRNRNKIVTKDGLLWLSIPVISKGKFYQKIKETKVSDNNWADNHWKAIQCNYSKTTYFDLYADRIKKIYDLCKNIVFLSEINYIFMKEICDILGIQTKITWSSDYHLVDGKTERLVGLVKEAGGNIYLSGPSAKNYIDPELFCEAGIGLEWMDYTGYPEYTQQSDEFEHHVSVLDLIFNEGIESKNFMKSFMNV
ncbi:WbqC family protein [Candidatus Ventrimonas sp. KK005]